MRETQVSQKILLEAVNPESPSSPMVLSKGSKQE